MIALATDTSFAQDWNFLNIGEPTVNPVYYRRQLFDGLVGIGPFAPNPVFDPSCLLHLHSTRQTYVAETHYFPALIRLQTQVENNGTNNVNSFGESGIEFYSGSTLEGGDGEWITGKIVSIANGHGINTQYTPARFAPNPPNKIDLRGGLAFFCSNSRSTTLPKTTNREVMRIVDGMVGIGTDKPKELLHLYEKMTFHVGATEYYMGYNMNYVHIPDPLNPNDFDEDNLLTGIFQHQRFHPTLSSTMGIIFKEDHNNMYLYSSRIGLQHSIFASGYAHLTYKFKILQSHS